MANVFKNPLVIAEEVVGSLIDQRSVVLYEQPEFWKAKSELQKAFDGTMLEPTVTDFITKRELNELFKGTEIPYLSAINGFQMWGVSYMDADVDISSDLCDHPVETGQLITDASIQNPVSAEVRIAMPTAFYTQIYEQIKDYYVNKKKIVLLTKFGVYENMVIQAMPYKLENSTVDRAIINLSLREIMEVNPTYLENTSGANSISPEKALNMDDTDMQIVGQKRFTTTLTDSLKV